MAKQCFSSLRVIFQHCKIDKILTIVIVAYLRNLVRLKFERGADLGRFWFVFSFFVTQTDLTLDGPLFEQTCRHLAWCQVQFQS